MTLTPYLLSPEGKEDQKLAADFSARLKTIQDDLARIEAKLPTFKKETLTKLIDQYRKAQDAVGKTGNELTLRLEYKWIESQEAYIKQMSSQWIKEVEEKIAILKKEHAANLATVGKLMKDRKSAVTAVMPLHLAYRDLVNAIKKELDAISREKEPNPKRVV